jgi:L-ascorbate metabolism protein UlaG (beta-lactamase superfamily)
MVITYHGGEFFKVAHGDITIAINPISKESKLKGAKFGADMALVSANHPDFNGAAEMTYGERVPFEIWGPGEYEVKDVFIKGFAAETQYGGGTQINTVYFIELEGMRLLFLGAIAEKNLPQEVKENLDEIDILFVPIGGDGVLAPDDAHELAVSIEAKIIIPMHFGAVGMNDALALFMKEEGKPVPSPEERLTLKRKDLEGKSGEIIVLAS